MAEERTITTVFKADISNFSASTQQLNRYISQVNSEFRNATASMGRWNDNAEGLRAKIEQLNKVHDAESRKLKELEAQYAEVVRTQGANSKAAQQLATAINNQSAKVKETAKNIEYYTDSLKELEDAGVETAEELEAVNKKLEDQKQAAKDLGGGIAQGAATGIAGIGAACIGAMAGLSSLVEETKELRTQMGMLETTFAQQNLSAEAAEKTYGELFGVLGESDQATEAAQHLAQMANSEKELEQMTNTLTGVYATFGNSLPVEGLAEAMNHTAKLGEVQGPLADALEWSGESVDAFNEELANLSTEEERTALINSKLNELYGETANKYKEVNAEVIAANEAQNNYNQAMADIAEKVQPAITSFKLAMVGVLQTVLEKFNEVNIEGLIGKIADGITSLVNVALPPLMSAITWIIDNANWLVPVLGSIVGIIGAISAGIKIYNGVMAIARTVQLAWNLALSANPIGIVVMAIAGLVTAFVVLWNKCEGFRNFFIDLWETIKNIGSSVAKTVSGAFTGAMNSAKGAINGVIGVINGAISGLNSIKVDIPDWVPQFGGTSFGLNIPKIPTLAEGGVVDKATLAMIGEAGKEVVMPLENNTEWIEKLAERIGAYVGRGNNVYNITNKFERMETSRHALHRANLEMQRILREA